MNLPRRTVTVVLSIAVLASACGGRDLPPEPEPEPEVEQPAPEPEPEPEPEPARFAPLTGEPLDDERFEVLSERPLLVVKIANSPSARPQAGLDVADVVLEETVEGGITRFMALFHSRLPDQVGPVRSARFVDVELASGYPSPVFAYSGARGEVQARVRSAPFVALEEGAPGFVRTSDRRRPDNLFIVPERILEAGLSKGAEPLTDAGWVFDDEPPGGEITCAEDDASCDDPGGALTVAMSNASRTSWSYDADDGVYRRQQNGVDTVVTGPNRVGAANVVVLATRHYSPGCCDSAGSPYLESEVVGSDRGLVLRDGRRYEITWEKPSATDPLVLLDADGAPFPLAPGPTWMLLPSTDRFPG